MNTNLNPKKRKGLVFNIQRFSIHDGPGMRTTVFIKGCPLKCPWCSNPESQILTPNLMARNVNCRGCGACAKVCPEGAIHLTEEGKREIAWERCTHCLECVNACIYQSLNVCGQYMDAEEILDEVMRDEDFYFNSGGGLTVSGGEPLGQTDFVEALLVKAKYKGLNVALDTTGHAPWEKMKQILHLTDLILWDIKHLDNRIHKETTGVDNRLIMENLARAAKSVPIWLRIPLIARFNDSEEHIREVAKLGQRLGAGRISLLPYHEGGKSKCGQIGRDYTFEMGTAPASEHIEHLKQLIEGMGLKAAIGN